ncbi:MAG: Calx-beta domain-containing protein, partial [Hyphomicrobiales bacterium]
MRPARVAGHAKVNFRELERNQAPSNGPVRALLLPEFEEPEEPLATTAPGAIEAPQAPTVASPAPTSSFMGLDDIPMADSSYIIIPPDVGGAVGPRHCMAGFNNNYRVFDKSTGGVLSTLGTATFWAPSGETNLLALTDPRTLYDPYNNRWIAVMQSFATGAGDILVGVSETDDPTGNWFLYRFATNASIDFPNVGFNKNWIVVSINRYSNGGTFQRGITLIVNYPQARAGTGSGVIVTQQPGTHFCTSPAVTYSATEDTLFLVTHLSSSSGTYAIDTITGTAASPSYTAGGTLTRPGGGWGQPGGQILPQSAPVSGTSACSPPCQIESQDAQVRSAPVFRNGSLYYAQTIGLPATSYTHTAVQWTRLSMPAGGFLDGGRIDDATATSTNGGKWYAYTHIAVNSVGDFLIGYSQFSSAQHPAAGYSMHLAGDAAGTVRDPVVYKAGDDYYHKDFGGGRNRWGDFSTAQVDPIDDRSLWTLQEYAKPRVNTNDGTTGSNGSRWSSWWANVGGPAPTVTIAAGPSLAEGSSGLTPFTFTVALSAAYSAPVTIGYHTVDGTATVADNDYQAVTSTITIPAGSTSGTITVNVIGDTKAEADETFQVQLTSATNGMLGSPSVSTATILNDDAGTTFTITATAGQGGSITPAGTVTVAAGATQDFTIAADACYHIADVTVDGGSIGVQTSYSFPNVQANHTIGATFTPDL